MVGSSCESDDIHNRTGLIIAQAQGPAALLEAFRPEALSVSRGLGNCLFVEWSSRIYYYLIQWIPHCQIHKLWRFSDGDGVAALCNLASYTCRVTR